jgi:excisionase family DNA binding protein
MENVLTDKALDLKRAQRGAMAMSVAEAAAEAGIGRDSIYDGIRAGALEARKLGRRTIITRDALQRFLEKLPALKLPAGQQRRAA